MNLAERAIATDTVLDRFRDKPFSWFGANCIRLARAQAVALGHEVPPVPPFRSVLGAKRALEKQGAADVTGLLDKWFPRLPGATFMLVGDLCVLPGEHAVAGLDAVCIADGRGGLIGWHADKPEGLACIKQATAEVTASWRL